MNNTPYCGDPHDCNTCGKACKQEKYHLISETQLRDLHAWGMGYSPCEPYDPDDPKIYPIPDGEKIIQEIRVEDASDARKLFLKDAIEDFELRQKSACIEGWKHSHRREWCEAKAATFEEMIKPIGEIYKDREESLTPHQTRMVVLNRLGDRMYSEFHAWQGPISGKEIVSRMYKLIEEVMEEDGEKCH